MSLIVPPIRHRGVKIVEDGLKCHLDAGNINSYPNIAGYQVWHDLSGNNYNFYRGTSSSSDTTDPTFNGTPGGMSNEYFSSDGGDLFLSAGAFSGSILRRAGRRDQPFTLECWFWPVDSTTDVLLFANGFAANAAGMYWEWAIAGTSRSGMRMLWPDTSDAADGGLVPGTWNQIAVSGQTNGTTGIHFLNGAQNGTWSMTSNWTSGDSATQAVLGGRSGDGAFRFPNGFRVAIYRIYDRALSADELNQNFRATRKRFGI